MSRIILAVGGFGALVAGLVIAWRWLMMRSRTQDRWYADGSTPDRAAAQMSELDQRGFVGRWLYRAGYRTPLSTSLFVIATAVGTAVGLTIAITFTFSGLQDTMEEAVALVPGGIGETFLPVVWVAPWFLMLVAGATPWLIVRSARRTRIQQVEQDLPLALELLSTLSEAGLGFDAALTRILRTRLGGRPLAMEFQMFQADLLSGRPRIESLRRLSSRLDMPSVSVVISALVQTEQLGMGIARVLRQQADDMRGRRRQKAIAFANSLTTKRVIPLVICFLPGLFIWTLGPTFVQLFKIAETFSQGFGGL